MAHKTKVNKASPLHVQKVLGKQMEAASTLKKIPPQRRASALTALDLEPHIITTPSLPKLECVNIQTKVEEVGRFEYSSGLVVDFYLG